MVSLPFPRLIMSRNRKPLLFLLAFAALSLLLARPLAASAATSTWSIVTSPNPSTVELSNDTLSGVAALSDSNVWAVGNVASTTTNNISSTLIEHWNGKSWAVVPSPNVGTNGDVLAGVSVDSANDAWAVGTSDGATEQGNTTLIEHWNGKSWAVVPSPNLSSEGDNLSGVAAISPTNAWAVGWFLDNTETFLLPLILHWNGKSWSAVPTANIPVDSTSTVLTGISAHSASDIWVVGSSDLNSEDYTLHFNGSQWTLATPVTITGEGDTLNAVTDPGGNNAWAVGDITPANGSEVQTFAIHWNGKQWSQVSTPDVDAFINQLFGVAAISAKDVWAVGEAFTPDGLSLETLIEHWNGSAWSIVASPNNVPQGNNGNSLVGVAVSGSTDLWAVGTFNSLMSGNPGTRTLIQHTTRG